MTPCIFLGNFITRTHLSCRGNLDIDVRTIDANFAGVDQSCNSSAILQVPHIRRKVKLTLCFKRTHFLQKGFVLVAEESVFLITCD